MKSTIFWIPIEDELPEYELEVLVCDSSNRIALGSYSAANGWQVGGEVRADIKWWAAKPMPPSQVGTRRLNYKELVGWVD